MQEMRVGIEASALQTRHNIIVNFVKACCWIQVCLGDRVFMATPRSEWQRSELDVMQYLQMTQL